MIEAVDEEVDWVGGVFEAGEEDVALLPQRQLVVQLDVVAPRQQAPGLELDERGRDEEELGGDLNEHIEFVAAALREQADALGFEQKSA